jgi:hypothetical protein
MYSEMSSVTRCDGYSSSEQTVLCGVGHSEVLSLVLFNLYVELINDLKRVNWDVIGIKYFHCILTLPASAQSLPGMLDIIHV